MVSASRKPIGFRHGMIPRGWVWGILILILLLTAAIRLRLRQMPLERDEGEYAYAGQLLLQGIPPYQLAYNMKFPGTYVAYGLIMAVFGQTAAGIHLGFMFVNAATIVLVYLLAARLVDRTAGLVAAAGYAFMSLSTELSGTAAHATHFVILPALGGCLLLLRGVERGGSVNFFWSGVLFGMATLMKQPGAFFAFFGGSYLIYHHCRMQPVDWKRLLRQELVLALGVVTPLALTCLWLWQAGVFERFWFWTIKYASEYATGPHKIQGMAFLWVVLKESVNLVPVVIWIGLCLAVPGLVILWRKFHRTVAAFATGLLCFSLLALCPGFAFREHYFILLLPALALLIGALISFACRIFPGRQPAWRALLPVVLFVGVLGYGVFHERKVFFEFPPSEASRWIYWPNPFTESVQIANYLKTHAARDARIAVIGSEPQIYLYAQRRSATGYIYTYPLMEEQPYALQMQKEMIHEIESARPDYLVTVMVRSSWLMEKTSNRLIFDWCNRYSAAHYNLVGLVNLVSYDRTDFYWDDQLTNAPPPLPLNNILVLKRKDLP